MIKSAKMKHSLMLYITLFLWVLTGGSVFSVMERNVLMLVFLACVLYHIFVNKSKLRANLTKSFVIVLLFVLFIIFINYVFSIKPQDIVKYIYIYMIFFTQGLFCIFVFSVFSYKRFISIFYRILKFIRLHAILNALIVTFFSFILFQHKVNDFNGYPVDTFYYIFNRFADQYSFNIGGISLIRNQGLFWEPGVLQLYLNLLLFFQLYIIKNNKFELGLTFLAILTTYSTTAYFICILTSSIAIVSLIKRRPLIILPICIVAFVFIFPFILGNVNNKLNGNNETSSMVRLYDLLQQWVVIKENFLVGVGLDDQRYAAIRDIYQLPQETLSYLGISPENRGSSNSIFFLLGTLGVPFSIVFIVAYIKQVFILRYKWLISLVLLLSVMVEPLLLKPFLVTFIISGLFIIFSKSQIRKSPFLIWKQDIN